MAQALAGEPYRAVARDAVTSELKALTYDQYRAVNFRRDHSLWRKAGGLFRAQFFPVGFIYGHPVEIHVIDRDGAHEVKDDGEMFDWSNVKPKLMPGPVSLAGFRLLYPLHDPGRDDEIVAFLGASYFRIIAREQVYGISARAIAIDTGLDRREEFPHFRMLWLCTPAPSERFVTVFALLDSPGLTGAFRFVIRPGAQTVVDIRSVLFARHDISVIGIAPLTSMFLTGKNRDRRVNFRPEVHDSDGLLVETAEGERVWRPLSNPRSLATTSVPMSSPRGFGLLQRERDFANYQDNQARYHRRPSLWVEPTGDWGAGEVRLLEIPTDAEIHDNIVAFWVSRDPLKKGRSLEVAYRLRAVSDSSPLSPRGRAVATRSSSAEASGGRGGRTTRIFVDFAGGDLATLRPSQPIAADVSVSGGKVLETRVEAIEETGGWRLILDVEPETGKTAVLRAVLKLYDETMTETWTFALRPQP